MRARRCVREHRGNARVRLVQPGLLSSSPFLHDEESGPRRPRDERDGKVARAICPRIAWPFVRREGRGETNKNQAPKALPSWHASTSQPLSLNRITSRGLSDGISSSILSPPPLLGPFPRISLDYPPLLLLLSSSSPAEPLSSSSSCCSCCSEAPAAAATMPMHSSPRILGAARATRLGATLLRERIYGRKSRSRAAHDGSIGISRAIYRAYPGFVERQVQFECH